MEKIKQALDRARAERLAHDGYNAVEPTPVKPRPVERTPSIEPRALEVSWPSLYKKRVVGGPEATALVDTYRVLRTQVLQRMNERNMRTLGVTSANPGEGKSLTAVNLAISLARKVPVLLVDADLRRSSLHRLFDVERSTGLGDYLAGDEDLNDCIYSPAIDQFTLMTGGTPRENSSELLVSPKMLALVEALKRGDPSSLVIFDLPPLLTTDDALAFTPHIDAALLVVEEGRTAPAELSRATELLRGTRLLGTVLNKSEQSRQAYY